MTLQHLIVLGAGPKAVSIAAKLEALRRSGFTVPKLTVLDPNGVAANWAGEILEYTDGRQDLATPPLKDVGFPYRSDAWGASNERVNSEMLSFSWQAHLVTDPYRGSEDFASWVDRGMHNPILKQWANYLSWVAGKVDDVDPDDLRSGGYLADHVRNVSVSLLYVWINAISTALSHR
jgi:mycobactin lysine-N-oxygenase